MAQVVVDQCRDYRIDLLKYAFAADVARNQHRKVALRGDPHEREPGVVGATVV